ncbi:MAG: OmpA family protein [Candidatus Kapabacteria bacterium]|nr:OmpA family protein [Candidatus Kapabacteria bacterium]
MKTLISTELKAILILFFIFSINLFSKNTIKVNSFEGYSKIKKGDAADMRWDFSNAKGVRIDDIVKRFSPVDSFYFAPRRTTNYKFYIYNSDNDTIILTWQIEVVNNQTTQAPTKGPSSTRPIELKQFDTKSDFFAGLDSKGEWDKLNNTKILQSSYDQTQGKLKIRSAFLDENGNFLSGLNSTNHLNLNIDCQSGHHALKIINFKQSVLSETSCNVALMLDNSAPSTGNEASLMYLKNAVQKMNPSSKLQFSYFNQNLNLIDTLQKTEKIISDFKKIEIPPASGLCGLWKSAFLSIYEMSRSSKKEPGACIIVAFSAENSSIVYKAEDVVEISKKSGIPVYIIGVGSAINTNELRQVASASGGRFYHLFNENLKDIEGIVTEIIYSQNFYYEIESQIDSDLICELNKLELGFESESKIIKDYYLFAKNLHLFYSPHQAIASFSANSSNIDHDYFDNIKLLSQILQDNPDLTLEVIGHSSIEGSSEENIEIASLRSGSIFNMLIQYGVKPEQIKVRSEGANSPIYFFRNIPWQEFYNRRAEIRWLEAKSFPFEIIAEQAPSEDLAQKIVEKWEKRGANAYYERFGFDETMSYRVKLWGYKSATEADKSAKMLAKKFKANLKVE